MAEKKKRIDTNPQQLGINSAFAGLSLSGLPDGPSASEIPETAPKPTKLGRVILRKETAHRGGKAVIVVHDFEPQISSAMIEEIARKLRAACGSGGTVRGRIIEIQGEQTQIIREFLEQEGFRVAGIGG